MSKTNFWTIDGDNNTFDRLKDAKYHIWVAYTPNERIKYLKDTMIVHYRNGFNMSRVEIKVDDKGNVKYGPVVMTHDIHWYTKGENNG